MPNALPERVGFRMPLGREMLGFHHLHEGDKTNFGTLGWPSQGKSRSFQLYLEQMWGDPSEGLYV
jgi:hypothetical protein